MTFNTLCSNDTWTSSQVKLTSLHANYEGADQPPHRCNLISAFVNGVARTLKKLDTSKRDYCIKQGLSKIVFLFKMGTFLKGNNLLPEGTKFFL